MQNLNYAIFIFSVIFLYWCTSSAYNNVIRGNKINELPTFYKQKCITTYLDENDQKDHNLNDLSIYYSGTKKTSDAPQKPSQSFNQDAKVQEEILKIVNEKQESKEEIAKHEIKQKLPQANKRSDAFSPVKKRSAEKIKKQNKSVFDVLE